MTKETVIEYDCIVFGGPGNNTCVAFYHGEARCLWGYWLWDNGAYYIHYNKNCTPVVFFDETGILE